MKTFVLPCRYTDIGKVLLFHHKINNIKYLLIISYNRIFYYCLKTHAHVDTFALPTMINWANVNDIKTCIDHDANICYIYQNINNTWIRWNILDKKWDNNYYTHSADTMEIATCYDFNLLQKGISGILKLKTNNKYKCKHMVFHLCGNNRPRLILNPITKMYIFHAQCPMFYKIQLQILHDHCIDITKINVISLLVNKWRDLKFYVFYLFKQIIYFINFNTNIIFCYDVLQHGVMYRDVKPIIPEYAENNYIIHSVYQNNRQELCIVAMIKQSYCGQRCKFIINSYSFHDILPYEIQMFNDTE